MTRTTDLEERIRAEIEREGPMTFARFMELALYEPELGYYRQSQSRPTREGDFLTAPELHPIFGWTLAREIARLWDAIGRPAPFRLIEYGAGAGTLGLAIFHGLRRSGSELAQHLEYEPIELNEHRLEELRDRFDRAGLADALVSAAPPRDAEPSTALVLANEFLDALPVSRVELRDGELRELFMVAQEDGFAEISGPPSTPALAARLESAGVRLAEGQRAEISLGLGPWLDEVARRLPAGLVLVVDYGFEAPELYGARHAAGTLLAYSRHRTAHDPYRSPGEQDLTAHVDFSALRSLALERGFDDLGAAPQRDLLVAAGLEEVLRGIQQAAQTTLEDYALVRSAVRRLLDPRATGDFRALLLGRGVPASVRLAGSSAVAAQAAGPAAAPVAATGRPPDPEPAGPPASSPRVP